jgi:4-amino-4-deoxy-L-arabinose transferase-like glycosyltransferase
MKINSFSLVPLLLILIGYLIIGAQYARQIPAWQAPDEPAHYNYMAQVAANGCCPVIAPGDWDNDYLEQIKAARFADAALDNRFYTIQYEDHQPPLYYVLLAPVFAGNWGDLTVLRTESLVLAAGTLLCAWAAARLLAPKSLWLAIAATAFVAFLPQHLAIVAAVNNDALALPLGAALFAACLAYLKTEKARTRWRWSIALLLGLALLTKLTLYGFVAVVALAALLRARQQKWTLARALAEVLLILVPALLLAAPFWLHNLQVYGGLDFFGQAMHDQVVVGQLTRAEYIANNGLGQWWQNFGVITFQSFWGQFGWMSVPMTATIYLACAALTLFCLVGAGLAFARGRHTLSRFQWHGLLLAASLILVVFAQFVYYNLKFVQFQGRYLYPALLPFALLIGLGLAGWVQLLGKKAILYAVVIAFSAGMVGFAVYALLRIAVPALA